MAEVITSTNLTAADAPLWDSPEHHGPVVSVVTWMFIVTVVLGVTARTVTRYAIIRTLRWDDFVIIGALFTAIGQSIAVSVASTNGLGSHALSLEPDQGMTIQKALYASLLLYIVTLGLAKLSICIHLYGLSPVKSSRQASTVLAASVAAWAITSLFVIAFQCKLPEPWSFSQGPGKCVNLLAFWTYFGIFNIITDLALIGLPLPIFVKLQIATGQKAVLVTCYSTRLFVIAAQILQIYYLSILNSSKQGADLIYDLWIPTLLGQVIVTTSIIASCFPFFKFLIDALETGMVRADGLPTQAAGASKSGSTGGYYKARDSRFQKGPHNASSEVTSGDLTDSGERITASRGNRWGGRGGGRNDDRVFRMQSLNGRVAQRNGGGTAKGYQNHDGGIETTAYKGSDVESQNSQTHIMRKVEWSLTEENAPMEGSLPKTTP